MRGTIVDHILSIEVNAGGQFDNDSRTDGWERSIFGRGTEGGVVVERNAAKYMQRAGPALYG
jgi:hypothetical protein